jgi:3-deoxy-manno-octulosonate cytidylyltransferase (CMP-KDO synthetase)
MIIIPCRLNSSRFDKKVLVDVLGLPMFVRTAKQVEGLDDVVVATDSWDVMEVAKEYGIKAVMTSIEHNSGTDRIFEAAQIMNLADDDLVINVQADEPFIEAELVQKVIEKTKASSEQSLMTSCYKQIDSELADDPNHVKVVLDNHFNAIYFSRAKVPYHRDHYEKRSYYGHLGLYGFTKKNLETFCSLPHSSLEGIEKLEQLRAIDNGYTISMVEVESESFGIDTEEDLKNAIRIFGKN